MNNCVGKQYKRDRAHLALQTRELFDIVDKLVEEIKSIPPASLVDLTADDEGSSSKKTSDRKYSFGDFAACPCVRALAMIKLSRWLKGLLNKLPVGCNLCCRV